MTFLLPFAQFRYLKTDVFQLLLVTFYKVFLPDWKFLYTML